MSRDRDKIVSDLERHKRFLDFTDAGIGQDLCKMASDSALENIIGEQDADGNKWDKLDPDYARMKARRYPGRPLGVLHFLMAQPVEVAGHVDIKAETAVVTYGTSPDAIQEASWFQEGDSARNRPPRRFWGLNANALKAIKDYLDRRYKSIVS